jgi:hypothetical protein
MKAVDFPVNTNAITAAMRTAWLRMVNKRLKERPRDAADWCYDAKLPDSTRSKRRRKKPA